MTPMELMVLRFMSTVGEPVSSQRIASHCGMTLICIDLILESLKRQFLIEQDCQFFKPAKRAKRVLRDFGNSFHYAPFEGHLEW